MTFEMSPEELGPLLTVLEQSLPTIEKEIKRHWHEYHLPEKEIKRYWQADHFRGEARKQDLRAIRDSYLFWSKLLRDHVTELRARDDPTQRIDIYSLLGKTSHYTLGKTSQQNAVLQSFDEPDYHRSGVTFFENTKGQLREAICGKHGIYRKERKKIESSTEACITTLVPVVLSALHLPGSMAGAAIVIVLMVSKIGVRAFCESTAPAAERKSADSKPTKKRSKPDSSRSSEPPGRDSSIR